MKKFILLLFISLTVLISSGQDQALISNVRKISATQGGFTGQLGEGDQFGYIEAIGDVNGDGIEDMAVGAPWDDDGGSDYGAVYILFMNQDRTVKDQQKISAIHGSFTGKMSANDRFGVDIAALGDLNKDGIPDIVVGANTDYDGGTNSGAVWILFLNRDGSVKSHQKISASQGGLVGLTASRQFGYGIASLGDLDGDGTTDIAVGSPTYDNDGGLYKGCVWILFLNSNGTVKAQQKVNDFQGGFTGVLDNHDRFGATVVNMGDINGDGVVDIAVHAMMDDDGATDAGAVYLLFLMPNGTVKQTQKISATQGGFKGKINAGDSFGVSIVNLGDIDGDGINDMFAGAPHLGANFIKDTTQIAEGYFLYLNNNGTVKDFLQISTQFPEWNSSIEKGDYFGVSASCFSGYNAANKKELIIGASLDNDGFANAGAVYILDLDVKHKPTAMAGNDITACESNTYEINGVNSSVPDNDPLSYSWVCPEAPELNNESISFSFVAPEVEMPQSYNFVLTVSCQGIFSDPDTITITVNPPPDVAITAANGFLQTVPNSFASYQWYLSGQSIINATENQYEPTEDGSYTVVATNNNGCTSQHSEIYEVIESPIPIIAGPDSVCASSVINLDGTSSHFPDGSKTGLTYEWSCLNFTIDGISMPEIELLAPEVNQDTPLDFVLKVATLKGTFQKTDTMRVIVKPLPQVPTIEQFADTLLASKAFNYFWYYNGTQIAGENDSVLIISKTGEYQVKQNNEFGCMSEISPSYHIIFSSVNSLNNQIKFFPNPVTENFNVSGFEGTALLTVTDLNGKIYLSKRILQHELINASTLPRGVYFAKLQKENIVVNEKFIKY